MVQNKNDGTGKLKNVMHDNPVTLSVIVFFLCCTTIVFVIFTNRQLQKRDANLMESNIKSQVQKNLNTSLRNCQNALLSLALTIDDNGEPQNFELIAEKILSNSPDLDVLEMVPNGVIKYLYPLQGNQAAINYNILADTNTQQEALKAIEQRSIYFAGPLNLKQGGIGVVGRLPVFISDTFWGFSACVIHFNTLIKSAGISQIDTDKFIVKLSKVNPNTGEIENFLSESHTDSDTEGDEIVFPQGDWKLYLKYKVGFWRTMSNWIILAIGLLFSIVCAVLVYKNLAKSREVMSKLYEQINAHLENSPLGIVEYSNDLKVTRWSIRSEEIFGWKEDELLAKNMGAFNLIHKDDIEKTQIIAKELLDGKVKGNVSRNRNYSKAGEVIHCIWYNSVIKNRKGQVISIMSLVQDITRESLAELEQHKIFHRLDLIFNATTDWMVLLHVASNNDIYYELANAQLLNSMGFEMEEIIGKKLGKLGYDASNEFYNICVETIKNKKSNTHELQFSVHERSFIAEVTITPIYDGGQECINLLCVGRDITQKRQSELEHQKTYQLTKEQNNRLLNFSYIVSHNLRAHTSNISGIVSMLQDQIEKESNKKLLKYLKTVSDSLNNTMFYLNDVVNIQTNKQIKIESINLADEIDKAVYLLADVKSENQAIIENKVSPETSIPFNLTYLQSILFNFIHNALKYRSPLRSPHIIISAYSKDDYVVLEIKDNGLGIDLEKNGNHIFGMYKRFHHKIKGTGVGLFITKNQIEALGGQVAVESTEGLGTSFSVYFQKTIPNVFK